MVPNGWKNGIIEDIAKVASGGTPSRKKESYWNGHIPWVTTSEVKFGVITDTEQKITQEGLDNSSAKLFPEDTILMAMYGQGKTRGQVAKLGIEASTNQACAALILNKDHDVSYYYQYLTSQYENIRELANSGGQQNLSAGIIKDIHVPIPPLPEQRKIAKILSTWDKAISTTEALIETSKQQKKALMQQLLTGKKRLVDPLTGEKFEGEWENVALKKLISEVKRTKEAEPNNVELLTVKLHHKGVKASGKYPNATKGGRPYYKRNKGELIIGRQNLHNGGIAIVTEKCDGLIASNAISSFEVTSSANVQFILNKMSTAHFIYTIDNLTGGTGQKEISVKELLKIQISVPSIKEQQKIAQVLTAADKEIEIFESKLAHLKQEKKALMQQLLTGKRRVKVDEEEAA